MSRFRFALLGALVLLATTIGAAGTAAAQSEYPNKPIRVVVPWSRNRSGRNRLEANLSVINELG